MTVHLHTILITFSFTYELFFIVRVFGSGYDYTNEDTKKLAFHVLFSTTTYLKRIIHESIDEKYVTGRHEHMTPNS